MLNTQKVFQFLKNRLNLVNFTRGSSVPYFHSHKLPSHSFLPFHEFY